MMRTQQHTRARFQSVYHSKIKIASAALLMALLTACSFNLSAGTLSEKTKTAAGTSQFHKQWLKQGDAYVMTETRHGTGGPTFLVIEGDGAAYDALGYATGNPTPLDTTAQDIAAAIAARYPSAKVIYAARPCQYLDNATAAHCPSSLWRTERFGKEAQGFYQHLIGNDRPIIVGYSGGGVIGAHLAAQGRARALITIASPLALNKWAVLHDLTAFPLRDDPLMVRKNIKVSQLHLVGQRDSTVPPTIAKSYGRGNIWVMENYRHNSDWRQPVLDAIKDLSYEL